MIYVGAALARGDHIDGGDGFDTLQLNGDYHRLTLDSALIANIEDITLGAGHDYHLNIANSAVASSAMLTIDGSALGADDSLYANGARVRFGSLTLDGGAGNDTLIGAAKGHALDILNGGAGDDVIYSDGPTNQAKTIGGPHTIDGGDGNDTIYAASGDTVQGGDGNDIIHFDAYFKGNGQFASVDAGAGDDTVTVFSGGFQAGGLQGGTGTDTLAISGPVSFAMPSFDAASSGFEILSFARSGEIFGDNNDNTFDFSGFTVAQGTLSVFGGFGDDVLTGTGNGDVLSGYDGNDVLNGGNGNDTLQGQNGNDHLYGGLGADVLIGGKGADVFVFQSVEDSLPGAGNFDLIKDFHHNEADMIDLSAIDADTTQSGNQAFHLGGSSFTDTPGELIQFIDGSGHTIVEGDVNGDGVADFEIELNHAPVLVTADFVL